MTKSYSDAHAEMEKEEPDIAKVVIMLKDAMSQGDGKATYALATWYLHGKEPHVQKDIREGTRLLRQAAVQRVPEALYDLAVSYERGFGVRKNMQKALHLYVAAALRGDAQAVFEVGRCFRYGFGTDRDLGMARTWFERAEELGSYVPSE